ncbi:hypothetical protein [Frigoribacterium salinisoli]
MQGPVAGDALFGVARLALTIGSVVPLLLAAIACTSWVLAWRRRSTADVSARLHDLARVGLLAASVAVALLAVAELVGAAAAGGGLLQAVLAPSWLLVVAVAVLMTTLVLRALASAAGPPH